MFWGTKADLSNTAKQEAVETMDHGETSDVELLRDTLGSLRAAVERAATELAEAQAAAEAAFETGDPADTAAALERVQHIKDRLAGLQQQAVAAEHQLRAALQPRIDAWRAAVEKDGQAWRERVGSLQEELDNTLTHLDAILGNLGSLPEERTAVTRRWQAAWDSVAATVSEVYIERPATPTLDMPDIAPAMTRLDKLADTFARPTALRPALAGFLTMSR